MWGQVIKLFTLSDIAGIIPTRVGTSFGKYFFLSFYQDHPHACGDKLTVCCRIPRLLGSSPRVWGQVRYHSNLITLLRIIPTRVGTSPSNFPVSNNKKDHPHACGDKEAVIPQFLMLIGSSPRVWGQDAQLTRIEKRLRIIPTRVGTSNKKSVVCKG